MRKRLLSTNIDRKSGRKPYFGAAQIKIKDARRQMKIPHPGKAPGLGFAPASRAYIERSLTPRMLLTLSTP
ncbi:hypothetical protein CFter6_3697 [Collimonas fungivorans]|uniref:Uncharacterized protein n=1 Tax=Collimonas fungivorans TaxID=158899 RepID=A0A127PFX8_9BURK|nr:hypothetical protein CFter6_3697 [Collimonas fungivorans]